MNALAIVILVVLSLFTIWQAYGLVVKIIAKCKGQNSTASSSTENIDIENKNKEENE